MGEKENLLSISEINGNNICGCQCFPVHHQLQELTQTHVH